MIKLGTNTTNLIGIDKVRLGSELVYQKGNPAPATTTLLMHLDGNLVNEVDKQLQMGDYEQVAGKFLYGCISRSTSGINKILYTYGLSGTDISSGNKSATISWWGKNVSSSTAYNNFPAITLAYFSSGSQSTSGLLSVTSAREFKFQSGAQPSNQIYHKTFPADFNFGEWHYYACTANQGKLYAFVDGELYTECTTSMWAATYFTIGSLYNTYVYDELLVCNEALYLQDFTPPTKPWDYTSSSTNTPFYSNPAPTTWSGGSSGQGSAGTIWQGTNDLGTWEITCQVDTDNLNQGFNGNTSNFALSKGVSSNPIWTLSFPNGILISPTHINYTYSNSKASDTKIQGYNPDTSAWENLFSQGNNISAGTTGTLVTARIGTPSYFSKIRLNVTRYGNSQGRLFDFAITSGTIKYVDNT